VGGLSGSRPNEIFREFQNHIGRLLNLTVTDAPLALRYKKETNYATVLFRDDAEEPIAAPLFGSHLFLAISQSLIVEPQENKKWILRTMAYSYHLLQGVAADSPYLIRWEYVSRVRRPMDHPRHHVHLPVTIPTWDGNLDLSGLHLATGWVTIEEV
jgi:hypothetical protein